MRRIAMQTAKHPSLAALLFLSVLSSVLMSTASAALSFLSAPMSLHPLRAPAISGQAATQPRRWPQVCRLSMRAKKSKSDIPKQVAGNIFKEIHNVEAGCVLVASADEVDHYFRRGVALVLDHGPQGSRGVLLEMATAFTIGEMALPLKGTVLGDNKLFRGGSAGDDKVIMLHAHPEIEGAVPIGGTNICVGGVQDALGKVREGAYEAEDFKFIFNQIEWAPEQLEREVSQGLWRAGVAVPELLTRQVSSQSEREQLFGGVRFDPERALWDILCGEMGAKLEAKEVQYSRGRAPAPHIQETKKLLLKMMVERIFDFRNQRDAAGLVALLDGGAEVLGARGNEKITAALRKSWEDPFWSAELDKDSITVDGTGNVSYSYVESSAESVGGKAPPATRSGSALLSPSGLILAIHEPAP